MLRVCFLGKPKIGNLNLLLWWRVTLIKSCFEMEEMGHPQLMVLGLRERRALREFSTCREPFPHSQVVYCQRVALRENFGKKTRFLRESW